MKKKLVILIVTLALAVAAAAPASANPPNEWYTVVHAFSTFDCEFQVDFYFERQYKVKEFFDQDGAIKKVVFHWLTTMGTATNPANGKTLHSGRQAWKDVLEFDGDVPTTLTSIGLPVRFNIPGGGVVQHDAGRIVFDISVDSWDVVEIKGPHQVWEGDFDAFCAALADDG
jgi:hypothetical protein